MLKICGMHLRKNGLLYKLASREKDNGCDLKTVLKMLFCLGFYLILFFKYF